MSNISVIIPAYDFHDLTVVHVREAMRVSEMPLEIIVVNDGGTPDLLDKLKTITDKKCPIIYARINEDIAWNYIGACNLGTFISRGDYLAFEDNDNIPSFEFYKEAKKLLDERPEIGRVIANHRKCCDIKDILSGKMKEEWSVVRTYIPNQGTAVIRRDIFTAMKGQDERMCGRYGWMFYDLRRTLLCRIKTKFASADFYFYADHLIDGGGQTKLERRSASANLKIHREHMQMPEGQMHSSHGILNFTYTVTKL